LGLYPTNPFSQKQMQGIPFLANGPSSLPLRPNIVCGFKFVYFEVMLATESTNQERFESLSTQLLESKATSHHNLPLPGLVLLLIFQFFPPSFVRKIEKFEVAQPL